MGRDVARYVRVEMHEVEPLHLQGRVQSVEHLRGEYGVVRAGALLTMVDTAGGLCGGLAALPDGWVVSTNLCARTVGRSSGPLLFDSTLLRKGRHSVITAVTITDTDANVVMDGVLTSAVLVPEGGPPQWERPARLAMADGTDAPPVPMEQWLDHRVVDRNTIEIDLRDSLRNPWGILHGGVSAALVDAGAVHAGGPGITTDVVLHYLAPNRVGPVRATARVLGERSDGRVVRVELRDTGAARVTAVAIATVAHPPG
jgi:acyl-coenzyme A thioesterase PaaI-like protein